MTNEEAIDVLKHNYPSTCFTDLCEAVEIAIQALSAQQEIIRCKECKHRPKATRADEKIFYGYPVVFPDERCPCHCEDGWYGWYPDDDFYCGYAERRTDG